MTATNKVIAESDVLPAAGYGSFTLDTDESSITVPSHANTLEVFWDTTDGDGFHGYAAGASTLPLPEEQWFKVWERPHENKATGRVVYFDKTATSATLHYRTF